MLTSTWESGQLLIKLLKTLEQHRLYQNRLQFLASDNFLNFWMRVIILDLKIKSEVSIPLQILRALPSPLLQPSLWCFHHRRVLTTIVPPSTSKCEPIHHCRSVIIRYERTLSYIFLGALLTFNKFFHPFCSRILQQLDSCICSSPISFRFFGLPLWHQQSQIETHSLAKQTNNKSMLVTCLILSLFFYTFYYSIF